MARYDEGWEQAVAFEAVAEATGYRRAKREQYMTGNTRSSTEAWLESLGSKFIDVRVLIKGAWLEERHIADVDTLETTVSMSLGRLGATCAVWPSGGRWVLQPRQGPLRHYPSKEAAEMVAIHGG